MKYLILKVLFFLALFLSFDKEGYPDKNERHSNLSFEEYYPPHQRPQYLYHGADSFIMDEFELVISLLDIRKNVVVNNYSLSLLADTLNKDFNIREKRMLALRDPLLTAMLERKNQRTLKSLKETNWIDFVIDYNFNIKGDTTNYIGGEGYLPLPKGQREEYIKLNDRLDFPVIEEEPNRLVYRLSNYPEFYRFSIYTSEHFDIACLFGHIVLKLKDVQKRGLSLPRYAQYKHGIDVLFSGNANGYNGVTNTDEYVFPGLIFSNEVVEGYVLGNYKKRQYGSFIERTYKKVMINKEPMITCINREGRVLFQAIRESTNKIKYQYFSHADGTPGPAKEILPLLERIQNHNAASF